MWNQSSADANRLYATPFSRAYWAQAAGEFKNTRVLLFAALMIALRVALKSVSIPVAADLRIGVGFFVNAFGSMVYGPVVAIAAAAVTDTLGALLFPTGVYFFPFILTEIAGSLVFALFLYRARITALRVILSRFCINFFVNIVLQTPVMMAYYQIVLGRNYKVFHWPRILKNLVMFPIESVLLILFLRLVIPPMQQLQYLPAGMDQMRFTRKNIAVLAALTGIGAAAVVYYISR